VVSVSGWDGGRSHMDRDKGHDIADSRRQNSDDEYNDEYDRGKVELHTIKLVISSYVLNDCIQKYEL